MKGALEAGELEKVDEICRMMKNPKRISNMKYNMRQSHFPDRNSFESIAKLKEYTDVKDEYLVYSMNAPGMNAGVPYVFKSSKMMAELAIQMDKKNQSEGKEQVLEEVFFDGTHNRVYGFKTLTMWTMHSASRSLVNLASMECKAEDTECISLFFKLFNDILTKVFNEKKPKKQQVDRYTFNPRTIMCDENGANFNGIEAQCPGVKVITCQMHYKMCALQRSYKVSVADRGTFLQLVQDICKCYTVHRYEKLTAELKLLGEKHNEVANWIRWWDARKFHMVPAFRGSGYKGSNLAEIGHAKIKRTSTQKTELLLDAIMNDVLRMKIQDQELKDVLQNKGTSFGRGPTLLSTYAKSWREQNTMARQYGELLVDDAADMQKELQTQEDTFVPGQSSSHKAPIGVKKNTVQGKFKKPSKTTKKSKHWKNYNEELTEALKAAEELIGPAPSDLEVNPQIVSPKTYRSQVPACLPFIHVSNLPLVCRRAGLIKRCQGCKGEIDAKTELFVYKLLAFKPYPDPRDKGSWKYGSQPTPAYFHLSGSTGVLHCLRKHNPILEEKNISITNDIKNSLTQEDRQYLFSKRVLQVLLNNLTSSKYV
jgi:hypothetical protein